MALWLPDFFKQTPPLPTHFLSSNLLLWPSCALRSPGLPHRQQSPSVSPSVSPKTCSAECTLCAQVHTAVYSPPHTIQTLRMHPCTAAAESSTTPTQYCAMTAKQPSPAAPHTAAHPRPSPCTRIHTHVPRTPDVAPDRISPRSCPLHAVASTATSPFPKLTSCTHVYLHTHASPRVLNMSCIITILSQQQLHVQSPAREARLVSALSSAPSKARC